LGYILKKAATYTIAAVTSLFSPSFAQDTPEQKQERRAEDVTETLRKYFNKHFNQDNVVSKRRLDTPLELETKENKPWLIKNGIEAVLKDGTKYVLDDTPGKQIYIAVLTDNVWTGTIALYDENKSVSTLETRFQSLDEKQYASHRETVSSFFKLQEKMPSWDSPADRPYDPALQSPPKPAQNEHQDGAESALETMAESAKKIQTAPPVEPKPYARETPAILEKLENCGCASTTQTRDDYFRAIGGLFRSDSGLFTKLDTKLSLSDGFQMVLDGYFADREGAEGDADLELREYALSAGIATDRLRLWVNGSQREKSLEHATMSSAAITPTLQNDTVTTNTTDAEEQILGVKLDYLAKKNLLVRGAFWNRDTQEDVNAHVLSHVYGTVNGFPVDDIISSNSGVLTERVLRGGKFGLEWWASRDIAIALFPEYSKLESATSLNGAGVSDEEMRSLRLFGRVQLEKLVARVWYNKELDGAERGEWAGVLHYTEAFPTSVAFNVAVSVAENKHLFPERKDRIGGNLLLALKDGGYSISDLEALRKYRDFVSELDQDMTLSDTQRIWAKRIAFEDAAFTLNGLVIDAKREHLDTRHIYGAKAAIPIEILLPSIVFAEFNAGKDYRQGGGGILMGIFGARIGPHFSVERDRKLGIDDKAGYLELIIGK